MRPTIMTFRCSTRHWPLIVPRFESEHSRPLVTQCRTLPVLHVKMRPAAKQKGKRGIPGRYWKLSASYGSLKPSFYLVGIRIMAMGDIEAFGFDVTPITSTA